VKGQARRHPSQLNHGVGCGRGRAQEPAQPRRRRTSDMGRASGSYSSPTRRTPQGVTEPAQGIHRPLTGPQLMACGERRHGPAALSCLVLGGAGHVGLVADPRRQASSWQLRDGQFRGGTCSSAESSAPPCPWESGCRPRPAPAQPCTAERHSQSRRAIQPHHIHDRLCMAVSEPGRVAVTVLSSSGIQARAAAGTAAAAAASPWNQGGGTRSG
jgi:hypothetical protein